MMRETVAGESVKSKAAINEKTKDERIKDEKINGGGASDGIPDTPLRPSENPDFQWAIAYFLH